MIEIIVIEYLKEALGVPVDVIRPKNPANKFVIIQKTGSSNENQINSATFAIQSYGKTLFDAAELNEKVKEAMENIIFYKNVSKSALNTDYNFTDTTRKEYRYQAVYDLFY